MAGHWADGIDPPSRAQVENDALRARIAELEAECGRLAQYLKDTCEGMECPPECDSYGHEDACPVANPEHAWRVLREEVEAIKAQNAELEAERAELVKDRERLDWLEQSNGDAHFSVEWVDGFPEYTAAGYFDDKWHRGEDVELRAAIDAAREGS